jgi:thiol-disulfide isomerase/thioredoxin
MKKKILKTGIVTGLIVFFGIMGFTIVQKLMIKKAAAEKISELPAFKFYTLDDAGFTNENIPAGMPVVIIHFSPDCENCQEEAVDLEKNMALLGGVQILMVTEAEKDEVRKFMTDYNLDEQPQVIPLRDKDGIFFTVFGMVLNPLVFIYDKQHRLVKLYKGQTKAEAIQKALKNETISRAN